jgi:hypothetical protein
VLELPWCCVFSVRLHLQSLLRMPSSVRRDLSSMPVPLSSALSDCACSLFVHAISDWTVCPSQSDGSEFHSWGRRCSNHLPRFITASSGSGQPKSNLAPGRHGGLSLAICCFVGPLQRDPAGGRGWS